MDIPRLETHSNLDKNEWPSSYTKPGFPISVQENETPNKLAVHSTVRSPKCRYPCGENRGRQASISFIESNRRIANSVKSNQTLKTLFETDFEGDEDQIIQALELQDKIMEEVHRKKSRRTKAKLTLVHCMTAILSIMVLLVPISLAVPLDGPALFDKDQQMDKLISKNQIGYHFKKVVREVNQELFVSRRLDVSALFQGVQVLRNTAGDMEKYCKSLNKPRIARPMPTTNSTVRAPYYVHFGLPVYVSYAEAKAQCMARNMQLPEVYTTGQLTLISKFLKSNNISKCFAGLEPDLTDAIFRFAATGYPIWKTPVGQALMDDGRFLPIEESMDDFNLKFLYAADGEFYAHGVNSIVTKTNFTLGDRNFRNKVKEFPEITCAIVCEPKWDGQTLGHLAGGQSYVGHTRIYSYAKGKRSVDDDTLRGSSDSASDMLDDEPPRQSTSDSALTETMKEYCTSITGQALDIANEMSVKLKDLLSLVDISVQLESNSRLQRSTKDDFLDPIETASELFDPNQTAVRRQKRFSFLAKFIFKTGIKLIWTIVGFVDKIRTERRLVRIESNLSATQKQSQDNTDNIKQMTVQIAGNSIAINNLKVTTEDLSRRMNNLEVKVDSIVNKVLDITDHLTDMVKLQMVVNLINRIRQSMDSGYDTLKDIIHCSLLGQTSPLLLPIDQMELVQNEVRKTSQGIIDTDFLKMQSIVVADPSDKHLLLVVINVAALSRTELELVSLVSIPQFEDDKSFSPTLDYHSIVIDQLTRKYFILSDQEESDCMFDRCYISDVERSIDQKTCGIPQLFDQHLDACVYEETLPNNGVYVKPMLPDGIIFAFRGLVSAQLFCKDNTQIGSPRKLSGTGIMQLPNGCILSLTDEFGKNTKVRGQPMYRAIIAGDISLVMNGPLKQLQSQLGRSDAQKKLTADGILVDHLFPVVQQVNVVDAKVDHQFVFIWGLIAVLGLASCIIIIVIYFQFKSSKQFFRKIYDLRGKFTELGHQLLALRELRDRLHRRPDTPAVRQRIREALHFGSQRRLFNHAIDTHSENGEEATYISMEHLRQQDLPSTAPPPVMEPPTNLSGNRTLLSFQLPRKSSKVPSVPYPNLSQPLLDQMMLEKECEEVEELCQQVLKKKDENDYSK